MEVTIEAAIISNLLKLVNLGRLLHKSVSEDVLERLNDYQDYLHNLVCEYTLGRTEGLSDTEVLTLEEVKTNYLIWSEVYRTPIR